MPVAIRFRGIVRARIREGTVERDMLKGVHPARVGSIHVAEPEQERASREALLYAQSITASG